MRRRAAAQVLKADDAGDEHGGDRRRRDEDAYPQGAPARRRRRRHVLAQPLPALVGEVGVAVGWRRHDAVEAGADRVDVGARRLDPGTQPGVSGGRRPQLGVVVRSERERQDAFVGEGALILGPALVRRSFFFLDAVLAPHGAPARRPVTARDVALSRATGHAVGATGHAICHVVTLVHDHARSSSCSVVVALTLTLGGRHARSSSHSRARIPPRRAPVVAVPTPCAGVT